MQHREQATKKIKAIPAEKLLVKVKRTATGLLFVAFTGIAIWRNWPWYVAAVPLAIGAHIISGELVGAAISWIVGVIKDLASAIKNGKNGGGRHR